MAMGAALAPPLSFCESTSVRSVGMSDYVRRLRDKVGDDFLLMPSVAALIRGDEGRILFVQHVEGRWQLPGGAVDPGERPAEAMQRECREEAGITVEPVRIAGVFGGPDYRITYANGDETGWVVTVFEARIVTGEPLPSDDETQAVGWFTPEEIAALELAPSTGETLRCLLAGVEFQR
jgi:8-oxo-dGTP pyrophosphatase MutT (NUDIX family)